MEKLISVNEVSLNFNLREPRGACKDTKRIRKYDILHKNCIFKAFAPLCLFFLKKNVSLYVIF